MTPYKYIGTDPQLQKHSALGYYPIPGQFHVQVNDISHSMSHNWHPQPVRDWLKFPDYVLESLSEALNDMEVNYLLTPAGNEMPGYFAGYAVMRCYPATPAEPFVAWMTDEDGERWTLKRRQSR